MLEKFQGAMLGLAIGDSMCRSDGKWSEETQLSLLVSKCLLASKDVSEYEKLFAEGLNDWSKTQKEDNRSADLATFFAAESATPIEGSVASQVAFCFPVGLYYHHNIPKTIEYARSAASVVTNDSSSQCSAVVSALMGLYALLDVPIGLWGHELTSFVRGIDNELMEGIKATTLLCAKHQKLDDFKKYMGSFDAPVVVICGSLFSCMSAPNSMEDALEIASKMPIDNDAIASVVGGCMGAKMGAKAISEEKITHLENKQLILDIASELFNGNRTIKAV